MNITERVRDIFSRYNVNLEVTEQDRTEMAEATLDNGTVIYTDAESFEEGAEAYIINDEGERIPLPPGDYELSDGTIMSIVEGGKIGKVDRSNVKSEDDGKGDGKGKAGVKPGNVTKPEESAGEGGGSGGGGSKAPESAKDPKKGGKSRLEEDKKEEDMTTHLTREDVEEMIREALEAYGKKDDKRRYEEDEDKEEMSSAEADAQPEAEEAGEPLEIEVEMAAEEVEPQETELSAALTAIETLKTELVEMKKQAATPGLKHAAPAAAKKEPVDLKNLTTAERVRALANQFSK